MYVCMHACMHACICGWMDHVYLDGWMSTSVRGIKIYSEVMGRYLDLHFVPVREIEY